MVITSDNDTINPGAVAGQILQDGLRFSLGDLLQPIVIRSWA
jgi:hypothetical protein